MKVGLFINTQFPEGINVTDARPGDGRAGTRGARRRVRVVVVPASLADPSDADAADHPGDGLSSRRTPQGMTIGPNILILPPLNPMHVAEEAATFDVLTGGNYILGVGLGYRQPEFDAFGISLGERAPRFNESIG